MPTIDETSAAAALKQEADAALAAAGKGMDDEAMDAAFQAAIDKDLKTEGKEPNPETKAVESEVKKEAAKLEDIQIEGDIPDHLLGIKAPETKKEEKIEVKDDDAERKKFIEENTKGMSPKAADRFKSIEEAKRKAEQEAAAIKEREAKLAAETELLKKQLAEVSERAKTPSNKEEVEKLQKKIEELDSFIEKQSLAEHPKFKNHYDGAISNEINVAKSVVGSDNADEVEALLHMPDSKRRTERIQELITDMPALNVTKLTNAFERVDRLKAERASELDKWRENKLFLEQQEAKKKIDTVEQIKAANEQAWSKTIQRLSSEEGLEVFRKVDGNDKWNQEVESRIQKTAAMFQRQLGPEEIVEAAAKAVALDDYRKLVVAQKLTIKKLMDERSKLVQAEPDVDGEDSDAKVPDNETYEEAVARRAGLK